MMDVREMPPTRRVKRPTMARWICLWLAMLLLVPIADLGGWPEARPRFFDAETGLVAQIFAELGRAA